MRLKTLLTIFRWPHSLTQLRLLRDCNPFLRLHFLHAAMDIGLLTRLAAGPATEGTLAAELGAKRSDLLGLLLDLGVSLGELAKNNGHYQLKGQRARTLGSPDGDPQAALIQECVAYHGSVYRHLAGRIMGDPLGDYLADRGPLIARSSRTLEPLVKDFVTETVRDKRPDHLLEIGCGSGIYLHHAAMAYPKTRGVGIDLDSAVTEKTRANLAQWGITDRFTILAADIRMPPAALDGPFDLASLYNNLYYFASEERPALFRTIRTRLRPGGTLALVSLMQGRNPMTVNFDLVLRSTVGCAALPRLDETMAQLTAAGFDAIEHAPIMPGADFHGLRARRSD